MPGGTFTQWEMPPASLGQGQGLGEVPPASRPERVQTGGFVEVLKISKNLAESCSNPPAAQFLKDDHDIRSA